MKCLILALLLLPGISYSQTKAGKSVYKEISLNVGYAPDNSLNGYGAEQWRGGYIRSTLRALQNVGRLQYGISIEGGTLAKDYWYVSPAAILNWELPVKQSYFYAGGVAGYVCTGSMMPIDFLGEKPGNGYVLGVQGGYVKHLGKHFSVSGELAVRRNYVWTRYERWYDLVGTPLGPKTVGEEFWLLPVTVGVGYRF